MLKHTSKEVTGILTAFGADGKPGLCTGQVWLSSQGKIYRMPKSASGLVGQRIKARVKNLASPVETAIFRPSKSGRLVWVYGLVEQWEKIND